MRRALVAVLMGSSVGLAQAQVWEKMIVPGVTYREQVQWEPARLVHILRINPAAPSLKLVPEEAHGKLFATADAKGREGVSEMVTRQKAIAGINADFFPFTADPLGTMVREGELYSTPDKRRPVFAWGDGFAKVAKLDWSGKLSAENGIEMVLDGVNQEAQEDQAIAFTNTAALSLAKRPSCYLVCRFKQTTWGPNTEASGSVITITNDVDSLTVDAETTVIAARGSKAELLKQFSPGTKLVVKWATKGLDWTKARNVVGGGTFLLVDGKPLIDFKAAGFGDKFATDRHPRSAMGRTAEGDIILAVVDGRQSMSVGASLEEMAKIMMNQGCVEAINLDGGGSSTFNVLGVNLNRPSDGEERKVANGVLLYGRTGSAAVEGLKIDGPAEVQENAPVTFKVVDAQGKAVLPKDVFWSAMGGAWVDQTGTVRSFQEGKATVTALVRGRAITVNVTTKGKPPVAVPSEHPGITPAPGGAKPPVKPKG